LELALLGDNITRKARDSLMTHGPFKVMSKIMRLIENMQRQVDEYIRCWDENADESALI